MRGYLHFDLLGFCRLWTPERHFSSEFTLLKVDRELVTSHDLELLSEHSNGLIGRDHRLVKIGLGLVTRQAWLHEGGAQGQTLPAELDGESVSAAVRHVLLLDLHSVVREVVVHDHQFFAHHLELEHFAIVHEEFPLVLDHRASHFAVFLLFHVFVLDGFLLLREFRFFFEIAARRFSVLGEFIAVGSAEFAGEFVARGQIEGISSNVDCLTQPEIERRNDISVSVLDHTFLHERALGDPAVCGLFLVYRYLLVFNLLKYFEVSTSAGFQARFVYALSKLTFEAEIEVASFGERRRNHQIV